MLRGARLVAGLFKEVLDVSMLFVVMNQEHLAGTGHRRSSIFINFRARTLPGWALVSLQRTRLCLDF